MASFPGRLPPKIPVEPKCPHPRASFEGPSLPKSFHPHRSYRLPITIRQPSKSTILNSRTSSRWRIPPFLLISDVSYIIQPSTLRKRNEVGLSRFRDILKRRGATGTRWACSLAAECHFERRRSPSPFPVPVFVDAFQFRSCL